MIDGVLNPNADPQSFFVDALSLTATSGVGAVNVVPEPAVFVFAGVGVAVLSAIRLNARRRKS